MVAHSRDDELVQALSTDGLSGQVSAEGCDSRVASVAHPLRVLRGRQHAKTSDGAGGALDPQDEARCPSLHRSARPPAGRDRASGLRRRYWYRTSDRRHAPPAPRSAGDRRHPAVGRHRAGRRRADVEVEDRRRQVERAAGVRDVDDAADAALDRRRAEQQVGLLAGVAELLEVLDRVQARAPVGDRGVEVVVGRRSLVDRDPDEREELAVARLDAARA